jgi:hypothetical protein
MISTFDVSDKTLDKIKNIWYDDPVESERNIL